MSRLFRRKTGGVWYCWFYTPSGRRIRQSTNCIDKRAAELFLRDKERKTHDPTNRAPDAAPYQVGKALQHMVDEGCSGLSPSTVFMYVEKSGHLVRLMGRTDINALSVRHVKEYIATRETEGAQRETIRKELCTLRKALKIAHDDERMGIAPASIFPTYRVPYKPRTRYLTQAEFVKLLGALCNVPHRAMWAMLAVYTGGRDSEIDGIRWEDIDWQARTVILNGTKTAKARRIVPLFPELAHALEREKKGAKGLIVGDWQNVRHDLEAACTRAGIAKVSPNDLRRTFASWLKQAGVESFAVAQLMGHTTARMVELVYGQLDTKTLTKAVKRLPKWTWDTNGTTVGRKTTRKGTTGTPKKGRSPTGNRVPRARIELATRGFSVRMKSTLTPRLTLIKGCAR